MFWGIRLSFILFALNLFASDIAVVTMAIGSGYSKSVQLSIENKRKYCELHGYDFVMAEESLDPSRPPAWSKIQLLSKLMGGGGGYKWIFWTDADSLIMNFAVSVEDLIDDRYNLIISQDFNAINSGEFLIKNCEWSKKLLADIYSHTEVINHPWWENQALILELQNKQEYRDRVKILPQRLINSYARDVIGNIPSALYQNGDFIIHFASARKDLQRLIQRYSQRVVNDPNVFTLDYYLKVYGFQLCPVHSNVNEGFMTPQQQEQFTDCLKMHPSIHAIMEVGLNGGHSAENFFRSCPDIRKFVSFDINLHPYVVPAVEYLHRKHKDHFVFVPGDSLVTVPEYKTKFPTETFDLIYIDGGHSYECCFNDIVNASHLAHPNTILWVDDYNGDTVFQAVQECVRQRIIKVKQIHDSKSPYGDRRWIEALYLEPIEKSLQVQTE